MSKRDAGIMLGGFIATAAVVTVAAAYESDAATRYAMIGVVGVLGAIIVSALLALSHSTERKQQHTEVMEALKEIAGNTSHS